MRRITALLLLSVLTASCGQKGPLYLPDKNVAVVTSPPPAETTPAPTPVPTPAPPKKDESDADTPR